MNTFLGAVLILLSGGGAGLSIVCELNRRISQTEDIERIIARMQTDVCLRRLPLPVLLTELERAYPAYFSGAGEIAGRLTDISFAHLWCACVRAIRLYPSAAEALCRLGEELSGGEPPQQAFELCQAKLKELRLKLTKRREELGRVYIAAGLAVSGFFVILLL